IYIEPKSVDITIEERATKEFPVSTDLINTDQLPEGFELGDPKVEPGTVVITSSQSVIDQVAVEIGRASCREISKNTKRSQTSRRRYTISKRDWSSDVCSSDLFILNRNQLILRLRNERQKNFQSVRT